MTGEFWIGQISWLTMSGIAWDISGAVALSRGYFFVSSERLSRQRASAYGANYLGKRADAETRLDTRFGLGQLIAGFVLQLLAAAGFSLGAGTSMILTGGICVAWMIYLYNLNYWVLCDTLTMSFSNPRYIPPEAPIRRAFNDLSDAFWNRAVVNKGVTFSDKPDGTLLPE